ncbi:nuclease-related domain-containing protein [Macrococcus capreoli]|uniref:nuclease-related domain-containing protein n=1 Tax=Macrococcus capreoli TaxID=2982690 RepID=UPI0021D60136|nr:nuclease-related domain-containing protein [Macrococcus sp. TMW 2.2395]MCU7558128.1 NERD domain-containing protein [Macrococcus sp. TMW 2.2395]
MFLKLHEPDRKISYLMNIDGRCKLSEDDGRTLFGYQLGYEGEHYFYQLLNEVTGGLKLWDITLKESSKAQFDFVVIGEGTVYHFDVKNYSGIYTYIDGLFKKENGSVDQTIMTQLKRADIILSQFLMRNGYRYHHESRIVFVNESFRLKNFNGDSCIKFPNQVHDIINHLKQLGPPTQEDYRLARALIEANDPDVRRFAYYNFESLRKGYKCPKCKRYGRVTVLPNRKTVVCVCERKMAKSDYITECARQMWILKNAPFKIQEIAAWSGCDKKTVQRALKKYCHYSGDKRARMYWF